MVVGGGATGVEISGALVELLDVSVRRDRLRIDPERSKVILLEAGDRLLPGFEEEASRYAEETLALPGGRRPTPHAGGGGHRRGGPPRGRHVDPGRGGGLGGRRDRRRHPGGVAARRARPGRTCDVLEPDLSVAGHPEVFVVGDAGAVPWGPARPEACPQVAQVAIQSGKHAAQQIARQLQGQPTTAFSYHDKGLMATIGRHAAVAQLRRGPDPARDTGLAGLARAPSRLPGRVPQPCGRARELVVALPGLAVGTALIVADVDADP